MFSYLGRYFNFQTLISIYVYTDSLLVDFSYNNHIYGNKKQI